MEEARQEALKGHPLHLPGCKIWRRAMRTMMRSVLCVYILACLSSRHTWVRFLYHFIPVMLPHSSFASLCDSRLSLKLAVIIALMRMCPLNYGWRSLRRRRKRDWLGLSGAACLPDLPLESAHCTSLLRASQSSQNYPPALQRHTAHVEGDRRHQRHF